VSEKIRTLLNNAGDEGLLKELDESAEQIVEGVLEVFPERFPSTRKAWWACRILHEYAADPVGEMFKLLARLDLESSIGLYLYLPGIITADDCKNILGCLTGFTARATDCLEELEPVEIVRAATFCHVLGAMEKPDFAWLAIIEKIFTYAYSELDRLYIDVVSYKNSDWYQGEDIKEYEPAIVLARSAYLSAASASALLAISEKNNSGDVGEEQRENWRMAIRVVATNDSIRECFDTGFYVPPLPILLTGASAEIAIFLEATVRVCADDNRLRSGLSNWFKLLREHGTKLDDDDSKFERAAEGLSNSVIENAGAYRGTADMLEVLFQISFRAALRGAITLIGQQSPTGFASSEAVEKLTEFTPFKNIAPIAVESYFARQIYGDYDTPIIRADADLQSLLYKAGMQQTDGWRWEAPTGEIGGDDSPESICGSLLAINNLGAQLQAGAEIENILAQLQVLADHKMISFSIARNLLLILPELDEAAKQAAIDYLKSMLEGDHGGLLRLYFKIGKKELKEQAGPIISLILDSPQFSKDIEFVIAVLEMIREYEFELPRVVERLSRIDGEQIKVPKGKEFRRLRVAELRKELLQINLDEVEIGKEIAKLKGSDYQANGILISLLRGVSKNVELIDAADNKRLIDKLFKSCAEAGFSSSHVEKIKFLDSRTKVMITRQLKRKKPLSKVQIEGMALFFTYYRGGSPPVSVLPAFIGYLPDALQNAKNNPGELWEDRNWGGYDNTEQESFALAITRAIIHLAGQSYTPEEWSELLEELQQYGDSKLAEFEIIGENTYRFSHINLLDILKENLIKSANVDAKIGNDLKSMQQAIE
jgi:hypothetical protein